MSRSHRRTRAVLVRASAGIEQLEGRVQLSTLTVTSTADDGSTGTLRYAVANSAAGDTIQFAPSVFVAGASQTITLAGPFLDIKNNLTIQGPGANVLAISGNNFYEVLKIEPGIFAAVSGLTISNGHSANFTGGGVENQGTLTVSDCTFTDNSATNDGGAIENDTGTLAVSDCTFSGNTAQFDGAAIDNYRGTLTVSGTTFMANSAGLGAAVANFHGTVALANCTVTGGNAQDGGGLYCEGGSMFVSHCTIINNTGLNPAGVYLASSPSVTLNNTIVAQNSGEIFGTVTGMNNLIGDGSGGLTVANHNQLGSPAAPLDPKLGPLTNNGGPTQTMLPLPGSPAIDHGFNALALGVDAKPLLADQRGYYRIFNGTVDIGAVESGSIALLPGDADGNAKVDFSDLLIVARHFGQTNTAWSTGDFNSDGSTAFDDLLIVARNYGRSVALQSTAAAVLAASQAAAPQPDSLKPMRRGVSG